MADLLYLSLGSNLGDRAGYLARAKKRLVETESLQLVVSSPIYETEPVDGFDDQPYYLNQVLVFATSLGIKALFARSRAIEVELGRPENHIKSKSRTVDIDIVAYGDLVGEFTGVILPHPRYRERNFVLQPLADVAPSYVDPISGESIDILLGKCADSSDIQLYEKDGEAAP